MVSLGWIVKKSYERFNVSELFGIVCKRKYFKAIILHKNFHKKRHPMNALLEGLKTILKGEIFTVLSQLFS